MTRALLAAALLLAAAPAARAQISPGPLSRFHQELEGARNCRSCHEAKGVTSALCLTCHTALGRAIASGHGLHARTEYRACERCHVEHQGRSFELVFWGEQGQAAFDHAQTGFALQGRHARLTCRDCHQAAHIGERAALARGGVNLARTFLGLRPSCASCHVDPHRGQFAPRACTDCHGTEAWKPERFDHARTDFPLTGAHQAVACAACHAKPAGGAARFKDTPHQTCAACHQDPHAGRMGAACQTCHDTAAWSRMAGGRFDHGRTRFSLTGRHEKVSCGACHARGPSGAMRFAGTPFATCAGCHRDPHAGRLGAACDGCHTTADWARVAAGRFDHSRTRFPLQGRHVSLACSACHREGQPLALPHARCTDCHADRHAGQLARQGTGPPDCAACHGVEGFTPARFSTADHAHTRLPLTGAHLAVPCDACHREVSVERLRAAGVAVPPGAPARTEQFHFASAGCAECHADPHRGQAARWGGCESCHATAGWSAVAFDHARTGFALAGRHADVACRGCHAPRDGALALQGRPQACAGCHADPHEGHFARAGVTECARCHDPSGWRPARFDHDRDTSFPLVGAHRAVACAGCHARQEGGRTVLRYSGVGKVCSACHGAQKAEDLDRRTGLDVGRGGAAGGARVAGRGPAGGRAPGRAAGPGDPQPARRPGRRVQHLPHGGGLDAAAPPAPVRPPGHGLLPGGRAQPGGLP